MDTLAGSWPLSLAGGGAVQNGRERKPGRKKMEGEGRWKFVPVRSEGPWMMVATSGGRSVSKEEEEENDLTRTGMLLMPLLELDGAALKCFDLLIIQVDVLGSILECGVLKI